MKGDSIEKRNQQIKDRFYELHKVQGFTVTETLEALSTMEWEDSRGIHYLSPDGIRNIIYLGGYYRTKTIKQRIIHHSERCINGRL